MTKVGGKKTVGKKRTFKTSNIEKTITPPMKEGKMMTPATYDKKTDKLLNSLENADVIVIDDNKLGLQDPIKASVPPAVKRAKSMYDYTYYMTKSEPSIHRNDQYYTLVTVSESKNKERKEQIDNVLHNINVKDHVIIEKHKDFESYYVPYEFAEQVRTILTLTLQDPEVNM